MRLEFRMTMGSVCRVIFRFVGFGLNWLVLKGWVVSVFLVTL